MGESRVGAPGVTHAHEAELPSLPVPELSTTLSSLRKSVGALHNVPHTLGSHQNTKFREFRRQCAEFAADPSQGEALQRLLESRQKERRNWLESWWLDYAYLKWPQPVACSSSYKMAINTEFMPALRDSEAIGYYHPQNSGFTAGKSVSDATSGDACAAAAAVLAASVTDFALVLLHERLLPDMAGKKFLCMDQYRYIFTTYRWPGLSGDRLGVPSHAQLLDSEALFAVALCRGIAYKIKLTIGKRGPRVSVRELREAMHYVIKDSAYTARELEAERGLGMLTADERPRWAENLGKLDEATGGQFRVAVETIQNSLFVICLDPHVSPETDEQTSFHVFSGDARNRWYDKVVQLTVFGNGRGGVIGEHSPMDAGVVSEMVDWALERIAAKVYHDDSEGSPASRTIVQQPSRIDFGVTKEVASKVDLKSMESMARKTYAGMVNNIDQAELIISDVGSNWLKQEGGVAPDSFFQMVMQLAYFRLYGRICGTYETASTRKFYHGRTDVCRSATPEAGAFCRAMVKMGSSNDSHQHVRALLNAALEAHRQNMLAGVNGKAIDRHLLGLRILAEERAAAGGPPVPKLLINELVQDTATWRLSTSTVLAKTFNPGFSAVAEDGFGICYAMQETSIRFTVMSFKSCHQTSSARFRSEIHRAFYQMRDLLIATAGERAPRAKL